MSNYPRRLINKESKRISEMSGSKARKTHMRLGNVIESAEGVRFAYTETQLRPTKVESDQQTRNSKIRRVLGYILPSIDPVVREDYIPPFGGHADSVLKVRQSGRTTIKPLLQGMYVPSPEWSGIDFEGIYGMKLDDPESVKTFEQTFEPAIPPQPTEQI